MGLKEPEFVDFHLEMTLYHKKALFFQPETNLLQFPA